MRPVAFCFFCAVWAILSAQSAHSDNPTTPNTSASTATKNSPSPPGNAPSPLTPERPGFTNGSDVVIVGKTQVEAGIAETRASSANGGVKTLDFPETLIRHGFSPTLEWRVVLPDYFIPQGADKGFGDASVGIKCKFYQSKNGNAKAALTPGLSLPVGARAFSSGHLDPSLTLAAQTTSGARWGLSTNLQFSAPTQNGRRIFNIAPTAAVTYQLTQSVSVYSDIYDDIPRTGAPSPIADGGFTYLVNSELQLDAETGVGLGGGAPTRFVSGGIAARF